MTENNFVIKSASITDRGLSNKRPENEDAFIELNETGLFAVADGVGGAQAGDVASQMAMEIIGEAFRNLKPNEDAESLMQLAIERANQSIFQMSHELSQLSTMATTIVALHVAGNIGTIGHVGDSRLYRLDPEGSLFRETQDHSMVEEEVRAGRMTIMQAANHPSRNIISRALGANETVDVDLKTIMFDPGTSFLLCSDGITRHIDDFELRDLMVLDETPAQICQRMKDICFERGAEDNLTAVIAKISGGVAPDRSVSVPVPEETTEENTEETTEVRPRKPEVSLMDSSNMLELDDDLPTQKLEMPIVTEPPALELEGGTKDPEPALDAPDAISIDVENEPTLPSSLEKPRVEVPVKPAIAATEYNDYAAAEPESGGLFGKILSGLVLFLMGAVLGAGAVFIFSQTPDISQVTPPLPAPKTEEITLSAFENLRRTVDDDPQTYLTTFGNNPKDGEDYYLVGRANMLTGKFDEAGKAFSIARDKLPQMDEQNATVIENDILLFEAIVNNGPARLRFQESLQKNDSEDAADVQSENSNIGNLP